MDRLAREGLGDRAMAVGDVVTDVLYSVRDSLLAAPRRLPLGLEPDHYYAATLHRRDNSDDPARLRGIIDSLSGLDRPVLLLTDPRMQSLAAQHSILLNNNAVRVHQPLPYPELVASVMHSAGVVTDSAGLQKEAFLLRVPTTTIRPETEWEETVDLGWNVLANDIGDVAAAVSRPAPAPTDAAPYGQGHAAEAVVKNLLGES